MARIVTAVGYCHMPGGIDAVARHMRSRAAMTVGKGHCCQTDAFALVDAINHDRSPFYSAVALIRSLFFPGPIRGRDREAILHTYAVNRSTEQDMDGSGTIHQNKKIILHHWFMNWISGS
ncbi:hypothetical protein [Komagataeibacter oboediens]|uniref:hypothetical protein n=1 Tax=Komagataeibacter oboediens TaxID=65958 RepID=UPI001A4737F5|nr:hypothetical protein [Komagataeibacter oboediens]MBL7232534.1 hypothetical protein [Komagataeibacter oboediens]